VVAELSELGGRRLDELTFAVSTYAKPASTSTTPKRCVITWAGLIQTLATHQRWPDKDRQGWTPATYLPGTTRANRNVDQVSLAVGDFDHTTFDFLAELKAHLSELGVAAIIHSSYSNAPPDDVRFRVIVPLTTPIPADQAAGRWRQINDYLFLGKNDPQTKDWSRFFYPASAPPGVAVFAEVLEGEAFDPVTLPPVPITAALESDGEPSRGAIDRLGYRALTFVANGAPDGQQRGEALAAARNYLAAGYSVDQTTDAIWRGLQARRAGSPRTRGPTPMPIAWCAILHRVLPRRLPPSRLYPHPSRPQPRRPQTGMDSHS
jgi:hypothetical protein